MVAAGELESLRRRLHAAPELSGEEWETAATIVAELARARPDELHTGVGGHGVLAVWRGPAPGPVIALRAELDALPITESGRHDHRSRRSGRQHACGHDGHMAALVGVADHLGRRPPARGAVALLFQPAEETGDGAARVAADQRWQSLGVEWAFAAHNLPGVPRGTVQLRPGVFAAASVGIEIRLHGASSHAAHPEQGRSPAGAVAELISGIDRLASDVATASDSAGFAVSTVVHAQLGEIAFGTSPGEAVVMATLRSDSEAVFERLCERAEALASTSAARHRLTLEIAWREPFPVTRNHPDAVAVAERAAHAVGLPQQTLAAPMRWSEDFGHLANPVRGALVTIGAGANTPPLHSPDYDFPDSLLAQLVAWQVAILDELVATPAGTRQR